VERTPGRRFFGRAGCGRGGYGAFGIKTGGFAAIAAPAVPADVVVRWLAGARTVITVAVLLAVGQIRHRTGAGPLTLADAARRHLDSATVALTTAAQPVPDALVAARATITHAADDIRLLSSGAEPVGLGNGLAEAIPRVLEVHPAIRVDVADLRADPEVERVAYFVVTAAVGNAGPPFARP